MLHMSWRKSLVAEVLLLGKLLLVHVLPLRHGRCDTKTGVMCVFASHLPCLSLLVGLSLRSVCLVCCFGLRGCMRSMWH